MLRTLLNLDGARTLLERVLPHLQSGGGNLENLQLRDVRAGRQWRIAYSAAIRNTSSGSVDQRPVVIQSAETGEAESLYRRLCRMIERYPEYGGLSGLIGRELRHSLVVYPYPLDLKLNRLPSATSGESACRMFNRWSPKFLAGCIPVETCGVTPLRYVPGKRCQALYELHSRQASMAVLGKLLRSADAAIALQQRMNAVVRQFDRNGDTRLSTPRALGCLEDRGIVFQERVLGRTLYDLLQSGSLRVNHVQEAARSIAVLHAGRFAAPGHHSVTEELGLVRTACSRLELIGSAPDIDVAGVLERLAPAAPRFVVPVHRDFYDRQLIIDDGRTWLIDLDSVTTGPPEIDLGNFAAHLELRALQRHYTQSRAADLSSEFLQAYEESSGAIIDMCYFHFFRATTLARLAGLYRFRQYNTDLSGRLFDLVAHATGANAPRLEAAQ